MGSYKYIVALVNFFLLLLLAAGKRCYFYQELIFGQTYYIYNKEYPGLYEYSQSCLWEVRSGAGTKIVISCNLQIPTSNSCNNDRVTIYLSGSSDLSNAKHYCGDGAVSLVSSGDSLSVGLHSYYGGGKFICYLTSIEDSIKPPEHTKYCNCGWKKGTRIVGGEETLVNEYPSMAGLVDPQKREVFCGGTIVSDNYVITAAHCVYKKNETLVGVVVGDHNLAVGNETSPALHKIFRFIIHPNFNATTFTNDIAIVQTVTKIEFKLTVGPACLPFRFTSDDFSGQTIVILGWGQTEFSGPLSDTLQKVNLTVIPNSECDQRGTGPINYGQMCTFSSGKDACQSDSGGPLLWFDGSTKALYLVGVVSYGIGCATDIPGVNTRITSYLSWIVSQTPDAGYCIT